MANGGINLVNTFAQVFNNGIGDVVYRVEVIAQAADQLIDAGATIKGVVASIANHDIG